MCENVMNELNYFIFFYKLLSKSITAPRVATLLHTVGAVNV